MEEYSNLSRTVRRPLGKIFKEEEINSFNSTRQKKYFFTMFTHTNPKKRLNIKRNGIANFGFRIDSHRRVQLFEGRRLQTRAAQGNLISDDSRTSVA